MVFLFVEICRLVKKVRNSHEKSRIQPPKEIHLNPSMNHRVATNQTDPCILLSDKVYIVYFPEALLNRTLSRFAFCDLDYFQMDSVSGDAFLLHNLIKIESVLNATS